MDSPTHVRGQDRAAPKLKESTEREGERGETRALFFSSDENLDQSFEMKRAAPWEEALTISSSDSSDSDSDGDPQSVKKGGSRSLSKGIMSEESNSRKKKIGGMDFEALSRHGYHGGPSILKVPPPRVEEKDQDWSWSTGKRSSKEGEEEAKESYEERERTRVISQGEKILNMQTSNSPFGKKEKSKSFSQKEKKKRDLGQASRGKNYVEEEKRLLRDSGVYSGFDV